MSRELSAREVAGATGLSYRTVQLWFSTGKLKGWKPFNSNRAGFHTSVAILREFVASQANDEGHTAARLERWLSEHGEEVVP